MIYVKQYTCASFSCQHIHDCIQFSITIHINHKFAGRITRYCLRGIQRAKYAGQGTFTAQAIEYTREVMFSNESGGRQNVPEIMIIITDGISENQTATTSEAKTAKLKGIKIIVVGIGNGVDKTELQTISSDPSSKFMINVNSYRKLDTIMNVLRLKAG
jgi:hypothetical protein